MPNKDHNINSLKEVSIILAVIIVIMLITGYVPFLNIIGILVLPVAYTILYLRHNIKMTLIALIVSILLSTMIIGPYQAIASAITCAPIGIALGYCIKKDISVFKTLQITTLISALSFIVSSAVFLLFIQKTGLIEFTNNYISMFKEQMEHAKALYLQLGVPQEKLSQFDLVKDMLNFKIVFSVMPTALLLYSILASCINYVITRSILIKLRIKIKEFIPFSRVYLSNLTGAFLIGMICIGIIIKTRGIEAGDYIYIIFISVAQLLFMINGMASIAYYLREKRKKSKEFVFLILFFSILFRLSIIYMYIGSIEMFFDFRKLDPHSLNRKKSGV